MSGKTRHDENFPVGSLLIRPALRPHVHAFYTFARVADDIADDATLPAAEKLARLDAMEAGLLGGAAAEPPAARLRESLGETGVTADHACALLAAFRQDAVQRRYATWDDLLDYCRLSAMPVGRHVLDLHGEARDTWESSDALCASLQILNHLQDASKDLAALDRCYVPEDWLARENLDVGALRAPVAAPGLRRVMAAMLDRVDALNAVARALPRRVRDRRLRLETAVIVGLAERLARRLRAGDPVARRIKLRSSDVAFSTLGALRHAA